MDLNLSGKRVLVTGGSKGIGLAVAQGFAAEGCDLVLVSRSPANLAAAREAVAARHNVGVVTEALDLATPASAETLAARHADVDILVNNAGAIPGGNIEAVDEATWRSAWDLKVFGFINLSRLYFAHMRARKAGVIVNVIGLAGERPMFDYIAGTTGNAALMAFTRALGSRSVDDNVRVLAVNPPTTATDRMVTQARQRAEARFNDPERWRETLQNLPFDRPAKPEEIAAMVVFLASDRASYMSGTVVNIDGGLASRN